MKATRTLFYCITCIIFMTWLIWLYYFSSDISKSVILYVDNKLPQHIDLNFTVNSTSPTILIGIGCQKCGSTYFNNMLFINYNNYKNFHVASNELHYWNECFYPDLTRQFL
eukprot:535773_1